MSQLQKTFTGLSPSLDTEVGRVIVDSGLATPTEVEYCREQQKSSSDPNQRSIADLLVEHSFITPTQAKRIKSQLEERETSQIPGYQLICRVGKGAMVGGLTGVNRDVIPYAMAFGDHAELAGLNLIQRRRTRHAE